MGHSFLCPIISRGYGIPPATFGLFSPLNILLGKNSPFFLPFSPLLFTSPTAPSSLLFCMAGRESSPFPLPGVLAALMPCRQARPSKIIPAAPPPLGPCLPPLYREELFCTSLRPSQRLFLLPCVFGQDCCFRASPPLLRPSLVPPSLCFFFASKRPAYRCNLALNSPCFVRGSSTFRPWVLPSATLAVSLLFWTRRRAPDRRLGRKEDFSPKGFYSQALKTSFST